VSVTSASVHDLDTFVHGSEAGRRRLADTLSAVAAQARAVLPSCSGSQHPTTGSVSALAELLGMWQANHQFVQVIRNELVRADRFDGAGNATVSDAAITAALRTAGLERAPGVVDVPPVVLLGDPPYSGFVDDPICLANGNFLLRDGDLEVFGVASVLSVVRTYNSRDTRVGVFGPGWSSLLDTALTVDEDAGTATFRGPDGGGSVFHRDADGVWTGGRRRRQVLTALGDGGGWAVTQGHDRSWTFDGRGALVACTGAGADVRIARDGDDTTLVDATSGRSVRYRIDEAGRVTAATTSDGRTATYHYDDGGRLVGVERDKGAVTYDHDGQGLLATVVDADGITVCHNTYEADGRVLRQVEQHGRETRYEYRESGVATVTSADGAPPNVMIHDRRGRLTAMIDGLGATMRMAYDDDDNVVQVVDRTGAVTRYAHDERGNVVRRTDPDGLGIACTWDAADRLVEEVDRAGSTTRFAYEGDGRDPVRVVYADGSELHLTYDGIGLPTSIVDADGVTARLEWNADGRLAAVVDGLGARLTFAYDDAGRSIGVSSPDGIAARVALDVAGRVLALRTNDGEERFDHTPAGRLRGGRDVAGTAWSAAFDRAGDLVELRDDDGPLVRFERDGIGRVTATANADGARSVREYDPTGRITALVDATGNRTTVEHDAEGRPLAITDPSGRRTRREVDPLGRTTVVERPGGSTASRQYHPNGQLASITDAAGNTWRYEVDAVGRVVSSVDPLGQTTTYRYTPAGRLAEIVSPMGRTLRRSYDAAGRLARIEEPDGTEVVIERRADGAIVRVLRDGVATSLDYDGAGRASAVAGPWGAAEADRRAGGELVTLDRDGAASQFRYDGRRLLAGATDPAGVVTAFVHDRCGRLVAHTTGDASASYEWDVAGRLASVTDAYGNRTTFDRDDRGVVERIARPDGSATIREFGPDGAVVGAVDANGAPILGIERDERGAVVAAHADGSHLAVGRDVLGRITSWTTPAGTVRYAWDADGDLAGLTDGTGHDVTIERDGGGRAVAFGLGDGRRVELPGALAVERDVHRRVAVDEQGRRYAYDLAGRLAAVDVDGAVTTYGYDDLGLLSTERSPAGARTYRYGRAGELVAMVDVDGTETTFEYDATGRRTRERTSGGAEVTYRWDAAGRLVGVRRNEGDADAGAEHVDEIVHDPIGRPSRVNGVPILWDAAVTGNVIGIGAERYLWWGDRVRPAGDPSAGWDRRRPDDPWGDDGGAGLRLGFRGELALDGLLFLGVRVYDTRTRSFLSRDPLPSVPGRLAFAGVYSYAWCDPVNHVDPSGRRPLSDADYAAYREQASKGFFRNLGEAIADDPWKYLAKGAIIVGSIAVMALATATLGPAGLIVAGAIVGAVGGGLDTAVDGGDWGDVGRSALIGGVFGLASGGLGAAIPSFAASSSMATRVLASVGRNAAIEFPMAFTKEAADSYVNVFGKGDGHFDVDRALLDGTVGTVAGAGGEELQHRWSLDLDLDDLELPPESPSTLLPDPARGTYLDLNTASAADLDRVPGIGPVLSQRIIEQRNAVGRFSSPHDLLDIRGIGEARLEALMNAGAAAP
jgi:competence ComEA-like helix-hairpin-helix protein